MNLKKIFTITLLILFSFMGIACAQEGEIYLDKTKLPPNWTVKNIIEVPEKNLSKFSNKLGGEIERIDNYYLQTGELSLQINVVECPTEKDAKIIYKKLLEMKQSKLTCQRKNKIVIEYISKDKTNIKKVREINLVQESDLSYPKQKRSLNNSKLNNFLQKNYTQINLNKIDNITLLDQALKENEIFFTGEEHGIAVNSELQFKFLKYLKDKADIKYHLLELPYSTTELLNQYLQTGDEEILKRVISLASGTYFATQEEYKYWKRLYQYNKSLAKDEKIKLVGIDIEHQLKTSLWYLNTILPAKKPPTTIAGNINKIKKMYQNFSSYRYSETDKKQLFVKLKEDLVKNKTKYENYLGDNVFDFKLICENVLTRFKAYNNKNSMKFSDIRDKQIFENFKKLYSRLPQGKYYGQWGLSHAYQKPQSGVDWIASLMDNHESSPVKGNILSIFYIYKDCMKMQKGKDKPKELNTYPSSIKLDEFARSNLTLFKLTGENSPFSQNIYGLKNTSGGVTTDYLQYIMLIKNSEATTAY